MYFIIRKCFIIGPLVGCVLTQALSLKVFKLLGMSFILFLESEFLPTLYLFKLPIKKF